MADWNTPSLTDLYTNVLTYLKDRDFDAASLFKNAPSNPPQFCIRFERTVFKLQEWDGAAWQDKPIGVAGGGTGAGNAAAARSNLGIGSMGTQEANAVAITGGTISGLTAFSTASDHKVATDNTYDLAEKTKMMKNGFFKSGLVVPVGVDKWVT